MKKTLTQQLTDQAQEKLDELKQREFELEEEHKQFKDEDELNDENLIQREKLDEQKLELRRAIHDKYWVPSDNYGGSGRPNDKVVRQMGKKGFTINAIEQACDDLVHNEINALEKTEEYVKLDLQSDDLFNASGFITSKRHNEIHKALDDLRWEECRQRTILRKTKDLAWVQQQGKHIAERQRYKAERQKLEEDIKAIKSLLTKGGIENES